VSGDAIGIDLGTTNSVAAWTNDAGQTEIVAGSDGARIVPSVVYFEESTGNVVVGDRAMQYAVLDPSRVARLFKRGMGEATFLPDGRPFTVDGEKWSPEALSGLILKKLHVNAEVALSRSVTRAVITVPAYFGEPERAATRSAGEIAGLEVLQLINEPTAAAIAHGLDRSGTDARLLVFDLGGGTFDVTVMELRADGAMEVSATGGDRRLGGADFDALILERMIEQIDMQTGEDLTADPYAYFDARQKAEDIKKDLSSMATAQRPLTAGRRPVMFSLSRDEFTAMISDHLRDVRDTIETTISEAGIQPSGIDTVLMVGGSSRIPAFQQLLEELVGQPLTFSKNLDEDVARGASVLAAKLRGDATPRSKVDLLPLPVDAASHGLGITVIENGQLINSIMIKSGTNLPASASGDYSTATDDQAQIEIELNEGEDTDLDFVRQLGRSIGQLGRRLPAGHPIRIEMSYDLNQLIVVQAFDGETGAFICDLKVKHEGLLDDAARASARTALEALEVH
jgi:molecular chaperone DnaK